MRLGQFLPALAIFLLLTLICSPPVLGQCTDRDQDGFYLESGCGSALDCNDDDGSSHPGAVEVCDGRDNDCDGLLDNDAACDRSCTTPELVGVEVSLTTDTTAHPSVAWSGAGYGVAHWTSLDFTVLSLLNPYGQPLGTAELFSPDGEYPDVVWTGSTYGVAEAPGHGTIVLTRYDVDGNRLTSSQVTEADTTQRLEVVWSGSEFALTWVDRYTAEIYFARADATGTKIGSDVRVTDATGNSGSPSIVWSGTEYGLAWHDNRDGNDEIYFCRLDASGVKIGSDVRVTVDSSQSQAPSLTWTGSEYGLAWQDDRSSDWEVYFTRMSSAGVKTGGDVQVASATSTSPELVWAGAEYGLVWVHQPATVGQIQFARLDASGTRIGTDLPVSSTDDPSYPTIVWTGTGYGFSWQTATWEVRFRRIGCDCVDVDGDGVHSCDDCDESNTLCTIDCTDEDEDGYCVTHDCNDAYTACTTDCTDVDQDGVSVCAGDCDDGNPNCTTDCTDADSDGFCVTQDCDDTVAGCASDCTDADADGLAACAGDCDDTNAYCTTDCADADGDGYCVTSDCNDGNPNCTTDCTDGDGDGFCVTHDCDDTLAGCTTDCSDVDADGLAACAGDCDDAKPYCTTDCTDADSDGYCVTTDCDDSNPNCTLDCTDGDGDGFCVTHDCDEAYAACTTDCTDADQDGLAACAGDCDDGNPNCTTDCTDADEDGLAACAGDCDDGNPNCTTDCTDGDGDGFCVTHDCDDTLAACTSDCSDADYDGLRACAGDCDDGNEFCSTDCTDLDEDGYCITDDCDDTLPYCAIDCTDVDQDGYCVGVDCDDTLPDVHECDRACDVPGRLGEERYVAQGAFPSMLWRPYPYSRWVLAYQTGTGLVNDMYLASVLHGASYIVFDDILSADGVNECGVSEGPSIALDTYGSESYGVAWGWMTECEQDYSELHYEKVDNLGEPGPPWGPISVTGDPIGNSKRPSLVWADSCGSHPFCWGVAWQDAHVYFARINVIGEHNGPVIQVSDTMDTSENPSLVWTGSEFGVAWENWRDGNADIYFARIDEAGAKIGSNVLVTGGSHDSLAPSLVWNGTGYGITWHDDREGDTQVYFARLDATGNKIGSDLRITATPNASEGVAMAWTGYEYGLCWSDSRSGSPDIYFASVDSAGSKLDHDVRVSYLPSTSDQCDIVWGDSVTLYGVVWRGDNDIYFTNIGCDCPDGDGDTASVCMDCDDTNTDCMLDCTDADSDALAVCAGDCDDTNPNCTTDCTDPDGDGFCVTHDCDETNPDCNLDCEDLDEDGYCITDDCDDTRPHCDDDCEDRDRDGFCVTHDCDDTNQFCTVDCTDDDGDGMCRTPTCEDDEFCDNCPLQANPSQADRDDDGEGDVCDTDDGVIHLYFDDPDWVQWDPESGFDTWSCYSGDLGVLRSDGTYAQQPGSNPLAARDCDLASPFMASSIVLDPGEVSFMLTSGVSEGVEGDLGTDSEGVTRPNDNACLP